MYKNNKGDIINIKALNELHLKELENIQVKGFTIGAISLLGLLVGLTLIS